MSASELTTINKHPIRKFDVVETDQGNIAIVKELSSMDECSLSYLHEVPPGTTFAWWPQRKLKFLWNVADEHFKRKKTITIKDLEELAPSSTGARSWYHKTCTAKGFHPMKGSLPPFCPGCGNEIQRF